jgi:hypothetical protein
LSLAHRLIDACCELTAGNRAAKIAASITFEAFGRRGKVFFLQEKVLMLLAALLEDDDPGVTIAAANAVESYGRVVAQSPEFGERILASLIRLFEAGNEAVMIAAAGAVGAIECGSPHSGVIERLTHWLATNMGSKGVIVAVMKAITVIGESNLCDPAVFKCVRELLRHSRASVATAATQAVITATRQDILRHGSMVLCEQLLQDLATLLSETGHFRRIAITVLDQLQHQRPRLRFFRCFSLSSSQSWLAGEREIRILDGNGKGAVESSLK